MSNRPANGMGAVHLRFIESDDGCAYAETKYGLAIIDAIDLVMISEYAVTVARPIGSCSARLIAYRPNFGRLPFGRIFFEAIPDGMVVDHVNRNALDNRRRNLRICTQAQNIQNRGKLPFGSSPYKGVWRDRRSGNWWVDASKNRERVRLGPYKNEIAAARAYDGLAKLLHGEFAVTNADMGLI